MFGSVPPELHTAYPRVSRDDADPPAGLASIEALYVASVLVGLPDLGLLDAYRWREVFLGLNAAFFAEHGGTEPNANKFAHGSVPHFTPKAEAP